MKKPEASATEIIAKKAAAKIAADHVKEGMRVGLGTGSTATYFISFLAERCRNGLRIQAVATSLQSAEKARQEGIPLVDINTLITLDLSVDGADEIDREKRMIKGGGGALLREKIVGAMSNEYLIIVDEGKMVKHLGKFPLAIEISPFGYSATLEKLEEKGYRSRLRMKSLDEIYVTDNGGYITDIQLRFPCLDPEKEDEQLKKIPGVLETGLFYRMVDKVIVGYGNGRCDSF